MEPFTVVDDPSAWYTSDVKLKKDWIYTLTEADLEETDGALRFVSSLGLRKEASIWRRISR